MVPGGAYREVSSRGRGTTREAYREVLSLFYTFLRGNKGGFKPVLHLLGRNKGGF